MNKILTYLLGVILLTQLAQAKEQVFKGSATDSVSTIGRYTEGIGMVDFDIKYKLSIFMGDPLIKIKGKYTINSASLVNTKSNQFIFSSLPQDVQDKLSVNSVKATLEFYDGSRRKLKVNADLGAMGKQGEWSFNTPESRNWNEFIYTTSPSKQYLSSSEAKKAYRKMSLSKVYIENEDIKYNVLQAELYAYQQSHNKEKQKVKDKTNITMSQDEIEKKKAFLKDKQSKLSGSKYTDKERYLLAAIEQAKKQNEPENVKIFKKRLKGLHRANSYFKTEFKKLNREEKKIQAYNKKVRAIDKKYNPKISKINSRRYSLRQMKEEKIYEINRKKDIYEDKINSFAKGIETEIKENGNKSLGYVTCEENTIRITYWDHGSEDGDKVKVYLNEVYINKLYLKNRKRSIDFDLIEGVNKITIKSISGGSRPPNTASFIVEVNDEEVSKKEWNLDYGEKAVLVVLKI